MSPPRAVVVLGRGRVGLALTKSLRARGIRAGLVPARDPGPRPRGPTAWLLAVADRHLAAVAATLPCRRGDVLVHFAGMLGPEVVRGEFPAVSLHPLVAVSSPRAEPAFVGGAFLAEGDRPAIAEARRLVRALGGSLHVAARVDRARYHGAAALVASGATALAQGFEALARGALVPSPEPAWLDAAAASLLRSVAANVVHDGASRALASPLLRDDTEAVARHLAAMAAVPRAQAIYRAVIAQVVEALATAGTVRADTLARARALVGDGLP